MKETSPSGKICRKCNKEMSEDIVYCPYDGSLLIQKYIENACGECNKQYDNKYKFCPVHGDALSSIKLEFQTKPTGSFKEHSPEDSIQITRKKLDAFEIIGLLGDKYEGFTNKDKTDLHSMIRKASQFNLWQYVKEINNVNGESAKYYSAPIPDGTSFEKAMETSMSFTCSDYKSHPHTVRHATARSLETGKSKAIYWNSYVFPDGSKIEDNFREK